MRLPGRVVVPGSAGSENVGPLREVIGGQFEPGLKWGGHRGSNGSVDWATASMSSWAVPPPNWRGPASTPGPTCGSSPNRARQRARELGRRLARGFAAGWSARSPPRTFTARPERPDRVDTATPCLPQLRLPGQPVAVLGLDQMRLFTRWRRRPSRGDWLPAHQLAQLRAVRSGGQTPSRLVALSLIHISEPTRLLSISYAV